MGPGGGQDLVEPGEGPGGKLAQLPALVHQGVGRQDPHPAAIRQYTEARPLRGFARSQELRRVKEILETEHPQHAGTLERCLIDRIRAGEGAGVRGRGPRSLGMPPRLDDDAGFHARGRTRRRHELAGVGHGLHVEQDSAGLRVVGEVVQHIAEVHVRHVAKRDQVGKADPPGSGPVHDGGDDGPRLGDEGDPARYRVDVGKTGVEADAGDHDAQAVGADEAEEEGLGGLQHRLFELRPAAPRALPEAGRDDHRRAGAARPERRDDARHGGGRRADDREIRDRGQARNVRIARDTLHRLVFRVDR